MFSLPKFIIEYIYNLPKGIIEYSLKNEYRQCKYVCLAFLFLISVFNT